MEPHVIMPESLVAFCAVVFARMAKEQTNKRTELYNYQSGPHSASYGARRQSPDALSNHDDYRFIFERGTTANQV